MEKLYLFVQLKSCDSGKYRGVKMKVYSTLFPYWGFVFVCVSACVFVSGWVCV